MNTFSNSLFTFLFGWARALIESVWNAAAEGRLSGFLSWLGDHWLVLALLMCLGGTVLDFLIWFIRWRPYLAWRSTLQRWGRRLRGEEIGSERRFTKGYQEGVDLGFAPQPPQEYPGAQAPAAETPPQAYVPDPAAYQQPMQPPMQQPVQPMAEEFYAPAPRMIPAQPAAESYPPEENWTPEENDGRRRRRSEKHEAPRKPAWRPRFPSIEGQDEGMLDGLPPAVDRQQAFHAPVYPTAPAYAPWQNQNESNRGTQA